MVSQTEEPQLEYQLSLLKKVGKVGLKIEDLHQMEIHIRLQLLLSALLNLRIRTKNQLIPIKTPGNRSFFYL